MNKSILEKCTKTSPIKMSIQTLDWNVILRIYQVKEFDKSIRNKRNAWSYTYGGYRRTKQIAIDYKLTFLSPRYYSDQVLKFDFGKS